MGESHEAEQIERFGESLESKVAMALSGRIAFLETVVGLYVIGNDADLRKEIEGLSIPSDMSPSTHLRPFVMEGWNTARRNILGDGISSHDLPSNE